MSKLIDQKLGEVGEVGLEVTGEGKVVLDVEVATEIGGVLKLSSKNSASVDLVSILKKAKVAIKGPIDDILIDAVIGAIEAKKAEEKTVMGDDTKV